MEPGICTQVLHVGDGARRDHVIAWDATWDSLEHTDAFRSNGVRACHTEQVLGCLVVEEVGGSDEARHERRRRLLVDLTGCPDLFQTAVAEHGDPRAHRQCLTLVVSDEDERDAHLTLDRAQLDLHLLAQLEVERTQWFVEQEDAGLC